MFTIILRWLQSGLLPMADLTTKRRKGLPDSDFAIPSERKYPIHDRAHAANALSRVSQFGTAAERVQVRRAVCRRYKDLPECEKMADK